MFGWCPGSRQRFHQSSNSFFEELLVWLAASWTQVPLQPPAEMPGRRVEKMEEKGHGTHANLALALDCPC